MTWQLPAALSAMASYAQFIVCKLVAHPSRPGKFNKFPINANTGEVWNAHDPAIWLDHATASTLASVTGNGVGFVFTAGDPFWFLDIDNCLEPSGEWSLPALHVCSAFAGAAIEVSQSGRGLHLFGTGTVPPHSSRNDACGFEFYTERRFVYLGTAASGDAGTDHTAALAWLVAHYFPSRADGVLGSWEWRTEPVPEWRGPADDDALIERMLASKPSAAAAFGGRASFRDLWEGNQDALARSFPDTGGRGYDASGADAALASHLAYFTGNHSDRMARLLARSALARDKHEREDYLQRTIGFACSHTARWLNETPVVAVPTASGDLTFAAAAGGAIPATLGNVIDALQSAEANVDIALDTFKDRVLLREPGGVWSDFTDVHYVKLRLALERRGFKPVGSDMMRDAVLHVATERQFDSGIVWGESIVWDGTPRVAGAMSRYFGCPDTPYTRAVAQYLFTAMAGRLMVPGCQADMAVILVDPKQGTGKTSSVKALSPWPAAFAEIDLGKIDDDDTSRKMRGKLIIELGELRGLWGKDDETIKGWVSRTVEEWTPKFKEFTSPYLRRCVTIGTSNRDDLLSDPTGNRRWLPVHSGQLDPEALRRDCVQLWAEALNIWRRAGIVWQAAQDLAQAEHQHFQRDDHDPWEEAVREWLDSVPPAVPGEVPSWLKRGDGDVSVRAVMVGALRLELARCTRKDDNRVAGVLRRLGYRKVAGSRVWRR